MQLRRRKKCVRSSGENKIIQILKKNNIDFVREYSFSDCKNPETNRCLRFDFYLPYHNTLIEFQGLHHYRPINKKYHSIKVYQKTIKHDRLKEEYTKKHNINLVCINYLDYDKIENILSLFFPRLKQIA